MKTPSSATALLAILLLAVAPISFVHAQVLYTLESPNPNTDGWFGYSVSDAGDVNGDGYAEVIVGAMQEGLTPQSEGNAYVFCGNGGALLTSLQFPGPGDPTFVTFGRVVSGAGDLDSDGLDDVMATAIVTWGPWGDASVEGWVYAFSGQTGQVQQGFGGPPSQNATWDGFGYSIDGAGDVNGDGRGDVIVGSPWRGLAYVWDGGTGAWMYTLVPPNQQPYSSLGRSVSGIADLNADGCSDLVVGADYDWEGPGGTHTGRAYVFSGSDSSLVHTLVSAYPESAGRFGWSVSSVTDVNGDGYDDIIVGAHLEDGGATDAGRAYVFSGADGGLLYTLVSAYPESAGYFGCSVSGAGDVNADGYGDVVVGAYREDGGAPDAGRAYIFSGNGGSLLYVLESSYPESAGCFGYSVSGGGDMNGDGRSEVVVGAYREDGGAPDAGRVYVFNGIEVPVELSAFTAEARDGIVLLRWTTQTEQDNYGFHLYRAVAGPVDYQRITADIIPGAGTSTVAHHYGYSDRDVGSGLTYFYKLADVAVQGNQTFHGPVSVTVTPARFALLGNQPNPFSEATPSA
jgi:hypothetical protein